MIITCETLREFLVMRRDLFDNRSCFPSYHGVLRSAELGTHSSSSEHAENMLYTVYCTERTAYSIQYTVAIRKTGMALSHLTSHTRLWRTSPREVKSIDQILRQLSPTQQDPELSTWSRSIQWNSHLPLQFAAMIRQTSAISSRQKNHVSDFSLRCVIIEVWRHETWRKIFDNACLIWSPPHQIFFATKTLSSQATTSEVPKPNYIQQRKGYNQEVREGRTNEMQEICRIKTGWHLIGSSY